MTAPLRRRLGLADAVIIGAGSMIGAGVFSAWGPAADAAGTGLLLGLVVAAVVAFCNATSSAQLAARHPESGGTYVSARRQLGAFWGHLAGWAFVIGKTASCVALALTAGAYLWPEQGRLVGVTAVGAVAVVNIGGLTRTVLVTKGLLSVTLVALAVVVVAGWSSPSAALVNLTPIDASPAGVLRAAGFLFFAFAGYARIATLGEEVRDPATTIPKAIPRALAGVLVVYAAVGVTLLVTVPVAAIAASDAPLGLVVAGSPLDRFGPVVRVGAGIAALGVLLNLVPGVSRTVLAMARRGELPGWLARVDERRSLPVRAEILVAAVVIVLTGAVDLRGAIGFSGVTILTYYAITNAACLTLPKAQRRWPAWICVVGLAGCVILAAMLPLAAIVAGTGVLLAGIAVRRASPAR
jgi:basic amino acid/polyamine antiporter, APA family